MPSYQDRQRSLDLRERSIQDREDTTANAQDLHERMFGETQAKNTHEMGIQDLHAELDRAALIEKLVTERAAVANELRKKVSAAALVEKLSTLNPTHKDYEEQAAKAAFQYSAGAGSDAVKMVVGMQKDTRDRYLNTQNELFKAGAVKRIDKISESDSVAPALKSAITDPSGQGYNPALGFNPTALDAAEASMQGGGGKDVTKGKSEFYSKVAEGTGLSKNDLNAINTTTPYNPAVPGTVQYLDATGKPASSDDVAKNGAAGYTATTTLPNGRSLSPMALTDFNEMMTTHRNFQSGQDIGQPATSPIAARKLQVIGPLPPAGNIPAGMTENDRINLKAANPELSANAGVAATPTPTPAATPPPVATGTTDAKSVLAQYLGADNQFNP